MKSFDKKTCQAISADIELALQAIAKKHGVELKMLSGKFDSATYTKSVEFVIPEAKAVKAASIATIFGAKPEWINKSFRTVHGHMFTVTGINSRRPKNCMELRREDGKVFKSSVEFVAQYLK